MRDQARVLEALVECFDIPLEGAETQTVKRGALGADGGAPDLIKRADAIGERAYGAKASFRFIGYDPDSYLGELRVEDAAFLSGLP